MNKIELRKVKYNAYIASPEWEIKRQEVFSYKWCSCEKCWSNKLLQIHHWTYTRLYKEKMKDLFVLCSNCHNELHKKYWTRDLFRSTIAFIKWEELIPRKKRERQSLSNRKQKRINRNRNIEVLYWAFRLYRMTVLSRVQMLASIKFNKQKYSKYMFSVQKIINR